MRSSRFARTLILAHVLAGMGLAGLPPAALAVDSETSEAPDLVGVRAKIKAKDFNAAISELETIIDQGVQQADVYNLMGFSLRKSGNLDRAYSFYRKALEFEPDHKGALEYLGELYVERGEIGKAREHERHLAALCPDGCEELSDLRLAIAEAAATPAKK